VNASGDVKSTKFSGTPEMGTGVAVADSDKAASSGEPLADQLDLDVEIIPGVRLTVSFDELEN
jgi:hypothetical protein